MADSTSKASFSAYSGASDVPMDFAPIRADVRGAVRNDARPDVETPPSRMVVRIVLLLAMLLAATAFAANQYRDVVSGLWAQFAEQLPAMNMPEFNRPVINRAINTVRMESPLHRVTEQEVRTLLARYTESGFLGVNVQDLRDELERNPWVAQAMVRRVWPDVLVIRIEEERPVARWGTQSLLNEQGKVFTPPLRGTETDLPLLSGPPGSEHTVMANYARFSEILAPISLEILSVAVNARGSWTLEVVDGPVLRIGRDDLDFRLQRFAEAYGKGLQSHLADARTIDLRYSNGFSVSTTPDRADTVASR